MKLTFLLILMIGAGYISAQVSTNNDNKTKTMKSEFLGLRTVGYKVSDIQKAKEWYTNVFGVKPYYVGFNIAGYELGLMPEETPITNKTDNVTVLWGVENINESFDRLIKMGATAHEKPQDVGGNIIVASVKDPWGNVIGIIYNPGFKLSN
jgi:predicted enzyme related to lactoylglutathione lyase